MDTLPIQFPEVQRRNVSDERRARKRARTNMAPISKGILVNPGEDIQAAIDAVDKDGGGVVTLVSGTHIVDYDINLKSNISLVGAGIDITIIDFEDGAYSVNGVGTSSNILENIKVMNLTIQNSSAAAGITMQFSDYWSIENVRTHSCNTSGFRIYDCRYWNMNRCRSTSNSSSGFYIAGTNSRTNIRFSVISCHAEGNGEHGFNVDTNSNDMFWGNFFGCISNSNTSNGYNFSSVSASVMHSSVVGCFSSSNAKGFVVGSGVQRLRMVNCVADLNSGDGFEIIGQGNSVIGCLSDDAFDIQEAANFIGNDNTKATSDPKLTYIIAEKQIQSHMNLNESTRTVRKYMVMKNVGTDKVAGDTVALSSSSTSGDEITGSLAIGSTRVFGMVDTTINSGSWGRVLVEGFTSILKVDGTTDIAVGDYLTTFTTSGIASKASSGQISHAIALEAYTDNDSLGVIDALLIKPRQI